MHIAIRIKGITPLLQNKFSESRAMMATSGIRAAHMGEQDIPSRQAEDKIHKIDGQACMPSMNILASFTAGGSFFKIGKSKVTTLRSSLIPACLTILPTSVILDYKEPWTVFSCPVRIPSTGGRILAHRPLFDDWGLECELDLDNTLIPEKLMRQIVDCAGTRCGLGDFRPSTKGPFGRYRVDHWEVLK